MLVLALTDLHSGVAASGVKRAKEYLARITDEYQRTYYSGMVAERRGQALLAQGGMGSGGMAYDSLREAMEWYERAEGSVPPEMMTRFCGGIPVLGCRAGIHLEGPSRSMGRSSR